MTPQQQMQAITLGSGGIAGAAVGLLIYAFWPQPLHLNLLSRSPVQAPQFVDPSKEAAKAPTVLAATPAPVATLAAAPPPAATVPAAPAPAATLVALPAQPLALAVTPTNLVAAQTPSVTRGIGPIGPASVATPTVDASAKTLLAEGVALLAEGEIAASRLVLEQAANAGEVRAWVALGDSYDPAVLARLGALGVKGDAAMARDCYAKAASAGLSEARERIAALGAP